MSQTTNREAWAQSGWDMAIRQLSGGDTTEQLPMTCQDLLDALDEAHLELFDAQASFNPDDANSQAALARAHAHYEAAVQALEDFNLKA